MIRILLVLLLLPTLGVAQDLAQPSQRFLVYDVAAHDVLNIRVGPDVSAEKIGEYAPDAANIEVIRTTPDGHWGMVGLGERNGWVAMRHLMRQTEASLTLPSPLHCFGTEPFWSLRMEDDDVTLSDPELGQITMGLTQHSFAPNGYLVRFDSVETASHMIIRQGYCSDGMSDREFGFTAALFFQSASGSRVAAGCCTFDGH